MDDVWIISHVLWALLCTGQYSGGWRHIRELAGHNPCLGSWLTHRAARKAANKGHGMLVGAKCCGPYIKQGGEVGGHPGRCSHCKTGWRWEWGGLTALRKRPWGGNTSAKTPRQLWGNIKSLGKRVGKERIEEEEGRRI